jgi:ABC-type transport system involved in cytochrome c biogenesis permease subunit
MTLGTAAFIVLAAAAAVQIVFLFIRRAGRPDPVSHYLLLAAAGLLLADLAARSVAIGFIAVTNLFESLEFFAAMIALAAAGYRLLARERALPFILFGASLLAVLLMSLASSPLAPQGLQPPVPALRSGWLALHVTLSFLGEAFFAVGFMAALAFLFAKDPERKERIERVMATAIMIGYPIFTVGALICGAIWAQTAWGSFWSWDPKETWALVTFLVYTAFLHTRLIMKLRGKLSAVFAATGFVLALFTFLGVNLLLPGLHSYM